MELWNLLKMNWQDPLRSRVSESDKEVKKKKLRLKSYHPSSYK